MADLFSEQAAAYAKYRPSYPDQLYTYIFNHLKQKEAAWDCGTGSGQVAGYLADHFEEVYATDISQQQMNHAVQKKNISYLKSSAENTSFPPDSFDLITVAQAIHWFDFGPFFEEVNRTARDGAMLAVFGYGMAQTDQRIDAIIKRLYKDTFGKFFSDNRAYINKEYKTIPFPFDEIPTPRFQIEYRWAMNDLKGYVNSWSSVQKIKTEEGFNPADEAMQAISQKVSDGELLQITFPVFLRLGKIHKG